MNDLDPEQMKVCKQILMSFGITTDPEDMEHEQCPAYRYGTCQFFSISE